MVAIVLMVAVFVGFMIWGWQMSGRDDSEGNDIPKKTTIPSNHRKVLLSSSLSSTARPHLCQSSLSTTEEERVALLLAG